MAIKFSETVKEILGKYVSLGCTIDGKTAKEITQAIEDGEIQVE